MLHLLGIGLGKVAPKLHNLGHMAPRPKPRPCHVSHRLDLNLNHVAPIFKPHIPHDT
jgi:hypothetical protein